MAEARKYFSNAANPRYIKRRFVEFVMSYFLFSFSVLGKMFIYPYINQSLLKRNRISLRRGMLRFQRNMLS